VGFSSSHRYARVIDSAKFRSKSFDPKAKIPLATLGRTVPRRTELRPTDFDLSSLSITIDFASEAQTIIILIILKYYVIISILWYLLNLWYRRAARPRNCIRANPMDGLVQNIPVFIIASNRLAGEYLVHLLIATPGVSPILCDRLPDEKERGAKQVFILDNMLLPLPLGLYLGQLRTRFVEARYLIVDEPQSTQWIVQSLTLGAHGFLEHANVSRLLTNAVRTVISGGLAISSKVLEAYVEMTSRTRSFSCSRSFEITPRENQVLELVKRRYSNREIARILGVRESTIKYHVYNLFGKMNVQARTELISSNRTSRILGEMFEARASD
jgi:DNA-binding NarL/FixJ family response regulator